MTVELEHKDGEQIASKVTVHYDGRIENLEISEDGTVQVDNNQEAKELLESHGEFVKVDDSEPDHVLEGKTVDEVKNYVNDIKDLDRLKELRNFEDRKTGKEAIDNRIEKVKENQPIEANYEEVEENENQEEDKESEDEDGTENNE
jgi:hypothetical protein